MELSASVESLIDEAQGGAVPMICCRRDTDIVPATGARCPVCSCAIDDVPVICPRCQTAHHGDCWDYNAGCAVFGCDPRYVRQVPVPVTDDGDDVAIGLIDGAILTARATPIGIFVVGGFSGLFTGVLGLIFAQRLLDHYACTLRPPLTVHFVSWGFLAAGVVLLALTLTIFFLRSLQLSLAGRSIAERSTKDLEALLARSPDNVNVMEDLALHHLAEGSLKRSAELLQRAVLLEPRRQGLWIRLGQVRRRLDDVTGSAAAFQRAIELDPESPRVAALQNKFLT